MVAEDGDPGRPRPNSNAKAVLVGCLLSLVGLLLLSVAFPFVGRAMRDNRWRQVEPKLEAALRAGDPLLDALNSYAKDHGGHFPRSFDALIPRYLKQVPDSPPIFSRPLSYTKFRAGDLEVCELRTGVPIEYLAWTTTFQIMAFDVLVYRSDGVYTPYLYEKSEPFYNRVGRWAYYLD